MRHNVDLVASGWGPKGPEGAMRLPVAHRRRRRREKPLRPSSPCHDRDRGPCFNSSGSPSATHLILFPSFRFLFLLFILSKSIREVTCFGSHARLRRHPRSRLLSLRFAFFVSESLPTPAPLPLSTRVSANPAPGHFAAFARF